MSEREINQIIRRYTLGELSSFDELYDQYSGLVRNVLFKLCDPEDLDDLVQDVFVKIWNGLPKFKQKSSLKTWVYRIAKNVAVDDLRKRKRNKEDLKDKEDISSSKEQDVVNKDLVQKSLSKLSEEHRTVLVLHCMEEMTILEVAEVMNIPEGTVKSRLHHAKGKMYDILKAKGVTL